MKSHMQYAVWYRERQLTAVHLILSRLSFITHRRLQQVNFIALTSRELNLHREKVQNEFLNDLFILVENVVKLFA